MMAVSDDLELNALYTDERWWRLCDFNTGAPAALSRDSASTPSFVYDRKFGLIPVGMGHHQGVMALLLAWHLGLDDGVDAAKFLGVGYSGGAADRFLMRKGTAFRSSQSRTVEVWRAENLEDWEIAYFGQVRSVGDEREPR